MPLELWRYFVAIIYNSRFSLSRCVRSASSSKRCLGFVFRVLPNALSHAACGHQTAELEQNLLELVDNQAVPVLGRGKGYASKGIAQKGQLVMRR